jgi:hypothetical protein
MNQATRAEHLTWCALELVKRGDLEGAIDFMQKSLASHPETNIDSVMDRVMNVKILYVESFKQRVIHWIHSFD